MTTDDGQDMAPVINALLLSEDPEELAKGMALVESEAAKGRYESIYTIGKWYRQGFGGYPVDREMELKYLKKAAEGLVPDAFYDLGATQDSDEKADADKAFGYYVAAAILGNCDAVYAIIDCFKYGAGTEQNRTLARLLKKFMVRLEANKDGQPDRV